MNLFRFKSASSHQVPSQLTYSWILSNEFAIGQLPATLFHWRQLEQAGFSSRFSCCYPDEEIAPAPDYWNSVRVSIPDHREQEILTEPKLREALRAAESTLIHNHSPLYLHCFAGKERSALIAVGLVAKRKNLDIFSALDWVRRCHPSAQPKYDHLDLMERILMTDE